MPPRTTELDQRQNPRHAEMNLLFDFMRENKSDMEKLNRALIDHMKAEEGAMEALDRRLAEGDALMHKMSEQLDRLSQIQLAFPHDPTGKPDFIAHRMEHEADKKNAELWHEGKKKAVGVVVEWVFRVISLGLVAWVALQMKGGA